MSNVRLITDDNEARRVRESAASCFVFGEGFPGKVFHESLRAIVGPCYFGEVCTKDFGTALWGLIRRNRDTRIWIDSAVDVGDSLYPEFRRLIELPASALGDVWDEALGGSDIHIMAERVAVWGDSRRWGFWAERRYNLGILAERSLSDADRLRQPPFERDFDDELFGVIGLEFRDYVVPTEFRVSILRNYSNNPRAWQDPLPDEIALPWKRELLERLEAYLRTEEDEAIESVRELGRFCRLKGVPKKLGDQFVRFEDSTDFFPKGNEWPLYAKPYRDELLAELRSWYERHRAVLESAAMNARDILRKI